MLRALSSVQMLWSRSPTRLPPRQTNPIKFTDVWWIFCFPKPLEIHLTPALSALVLPSAPRQGARWKAEIFLTFLKSVRFEAGQKTPLCKDPPTRDFGHPPPQRGADPRGGQPAAFCQPADFSLFLDLPGSVKKSPVASC